MPGKNGGPYGFGTSLLDDSDVQVLAPVDGQVLAYSAALGKWINQTNSGGGGTGQATIHTPPTGATWTWFNQGSATIDETNGLYLSVPIDSTDTWRGRWKAAPATPYTIDILLEPYLDVINFNGIAVGWRNSVSGNMVLFNQYINTAITGYKQLGVGKANTTSIVTAYFANDIPLAEYYRWMRIADDGTNRTSSVSRDGFHWLQIHQIGHTDYITPDQVIFAVESRNATYPAALSILSWYEH